VRILTRVKTIFSAKVEKGLDSLENPKEMLDYSIVQMEKSLREIARNALEIGTAKKRLEQQRDLCKANFNNYQAMAKKALELEQEDLAKEALLKKSEEEERVRKLEEQMNSLDINLKIIKKSKIELEHKIELYRAKKEELKAVYDASQAQLKVKEIMTSLGKNSYQTSEILHKAENKIKNAQARLLALDELINEGIIEEKVFSESNNDLTRRLTELSQANFIDGQLAKLKEEIKNKNQNQEE